MSLEEKYAATLKGIADAWDGTPDGEKEVALAFLYEYAKTHTHFNGGDVLAAFREAGIPGAKSNWRNRWGAVITKGAALNWYFYAGRECPTSVQSHTDTLVRWETRLMKVPPELHEATADFQLKKIRQKLITKEVDVMAALWLAYDVALNQKSNIIQGAVQ